MSAAGSTTAAAPPAGGALSTSIFASKLSPALRAHLEANGVALAQVDTLSRTDPSRLARTALPHIGSIELVDGDDFDKLYDPLYVSMFPRREERERSDWIVQRLKAQQQQKRHGLAPYRVVGIRSHRGEAIGAAQFSVLALKDDTEGDTEEGDKPPSQRQPKAAKVVVPYLQYIYVRRENRRQDMSEVLHTMVLAVATADAANTGSRVAASVVPFTLFETEPPDHGSDFASRAYAAERSVIHTSTGGVALVLQRLDDRRTLSAHVQPGLEPADPPLTLVWVIRPSPLVMGDYDIQTVGPRLIAAYYQSLRDEGFPEPNIRRAEKMVEHRRKGSIFHLMPLADVKDFTDEEHLATLADE